MNDIVDILKEYFAKNKNIILAFLFGSQAKERSIAESDFDIAIWINKGFKESDITEIWNDLEKLLHKNVDLILLNKANPTIAWAALRGIPLLIRNQHFYLEYMLDVSREAEDFQEFIIDLWKLRKKYKKAG